VGAQKEVQPEKDDYGVAVSK